MSILRRLPRARLLLMAALVAAGTLGGLASAQQTGAPATTPATPPGQTLKLLTPRPMVPGATVVTLWPEGSPKLRAAPGYDQPEVFSTPRNQPDHANSITNIHNPSIELHLAPAAMANGLAIILAAGGGNTTLNVGWEGTDLVPWFNNLGISVFVERYRIQPYSSATDALYDTQRSIKMIRAHAKEWGVDPKRVGIMGFSAGGEQAARVGMNFDLGKPDDPDVVEHESSRPDFVALIYAGWGRMTFTVPKNAPPAFCTVAGIDDMSHATQTMDFVSAWLKAGVPAELHIYSHGGHANAMQPRNGIPFGTWQNRFLDWANDQGWLNATRKPVPASESKQAARPQG